MPRKIPEIPLDSDSNLPFKSGTCGASTYEVHCGWCNTTYNEGLEPEGEVEGESVSYVVFGGKTVAECCFRKLEDGVLGWGPDIVGWLKWRAKKYEQLARENREMAEIGAKALGSDVEP